MKNVRSKYVKESLLDYEKLTNSLKEGTASAVKDLLNEAVRDTYKKILSESDDEDYDEEEVDDTTSSTDSEDLSNDTQSVETTETSDGGSEETTTEVSPDGAVEKTTQGSDDNGNAWSEFEKYKVSDDKYDFSNAQDDEIVKAYKLMKDEDQLIVTKDGDMVHLQDNETGADYLIDLGSVPNEDDTDDDLVDETDDTDDTTEDSDVTFEVETDDENDDNGFDDSDDTDEDGFADDDEDDDNDENNDYMNEQRIFEIALNEYDSNVGYTDNYQKKDVMTNPGMSEPAKSSSVNDWDKGVPHGTEKPWSGKKGDKSENQPFHGEKGTTVEEEYELECGNMFDEEDDAAPMEEATNVGGFVQQNSTSKSHVPTSNGRSARSASKGGKRVKGTATPRYSGGEEDTVSENIRKKANAIYEENQQLKKALKAFRNTLNEAAVTNVNLGQIIKLISENTTSTDEKKEIIARFGKEAKTVDQSKSLYESISRDLKKKGKMNINEDKQFTANSSKMINETNIYKSKDLMNTLGLMDRVNKL